MKFRCKLGNRTFQSPLCKFKGICLDSLGAKRAVAVLCKGKGSDFLQAKEMLFLSLRVQGMELGDDKKLLSWISDVGMDISLSLQHT